MLSLDTAYRSFGGEVEASSTPTICRLSDSRRHQLWAIARPTSPRSEPQPRSLARVRPSIWFVSRDGNVDLVLGSCLLAFCKLDSGVTGSGEVLIEKQLVFLKIFWGTLRWRNQTSPVMPSGACLLSTQRRPITTKSTMANIVSEAVRINRRYSRQFT